MLQQAQSFIATQILFILITWIICALLGMWVKLVNDKVLYVRNLAFSLLFGPLYLCAVLSDMDAVLWDRRKNK